MVRWRVPRLAPLALSFALVACSPPAGEGSSTGGTTGGTTGGSTGGSTGGATGDAASATAAGSTSSGGDTTGEPGNPLVSDGFLVIAHRGGGALRPEETLPAFEHALAVGADVLEFDVHLTADGAVVAMHDETVDRTTDGTGAIKDKTLAELRALDAGYWFTPDGGQTFPYRGTGIVVPTVDEILDAFPDSYYLIEIKGADPGLPDALLAALAAHAVADRVVIASFSTESIAAVRAKAPAIFTALSLEEMVEFNDRIADPTYVPPAKFVQPPWAASSQEVVDRAHALELKVHPWTVNTSNAMSSLIARGVDGIMTDDPALLAGLAPN